MFKEYQGKAVSRLAHEVKTFDIITKGVDASTSSIDIDGVEVKFKHYEPVNVGDFIVYLTETDVYHCSRKVFLDRNYLSGESFDFGVALRVIKAGGKVARKGWNGKGMFVTFQCATSTMNAGPDSTEAPYIYFKEHMLLHTAQSDLAVWTPSVSDSLTADWVIIG